MDNPELDIDKIIKKTKYMHLLRIFFIVWRNLAAWK